MYFIDFIGFTNFMNLKTYTTTAIILNRKDFGESDRLFVFYSPEYGKLEAIAIGAKKASSKMAKFLEPLQEVELMLARGKNFNRIAEVRLLDNFEKLKADTKQWSIGCYCLEVVDKLTKVEDAQPDIFHLLKEVLNILKQENSTGILPLYVWQLLALLGYRPQIDGCSLCGCAETNVYFNPESGDIKCSGCQTVDKKNIAVSFEALKVLRQTFGEKLASFKDLDISEEVSRQINIAASALLHYNLDYQLNTLKFYQSL